MLSRQKEPALSGTAHRTGKDFAGTGPAAVSASARPISCRAGPLCLLSWGGSGSQLRLPRATLFFQSDTGKSDSDNEHLKAEPPLF